MIKCTTDTKKGQTHCEMGGYLPEIMKELYGAVQSVTTEIAKATAEEKDEGSINEERENVLLSFVISLLDMNDLSLGDLVNYAVSDAFAEGIISTMDEEDDDEEDSEIEDDPNSTPFHIVH